MEKIIINAGWVNGHNSQQAELWQHIWQILYNDPNTVKTGRSLGSCSSETTWDNGKICMTWKTDSGD